MAVDAEPTVGVWYETDDGQVFRVVAIDKRQGRIDIEYFDAVVDELQMDAWYSMALEEIETPERWHGSMDIGTVPGSEEEGER